MPRFLFEESAVEHVRGAKRQQAKWEAEQWEQARALGANPRLVERNIQERRDREAAKLRADVQGTVDEIEQRRNTMVNYIVDLLPDSNAPRERTPGAIGRLVDAERKNRPADKRPDAARLRGLPKTELKRLAGESHDQIELADIENEFQLRAEQGDNDARMEAGFVHQKLARTVAERPDVVKRVAEHERLSVARENIGYALKAIETGQPDEGAHYDSLRRVSAARAAGDRRPVHMVHLPDGGVRAEFVGKTPDAFVWKED